MDNEIKSLCAQKKWREAIAFVSRIKPGPQSGKREGFAYIGKELLGFLPESSERDVLLADVIEGMLQLGDLEHSRPLLLGLRSKVVLEKFGQVIGDAVRRRQEVAEGTAGK